jgi:hypothetical protein
MLRITSLPHPYNLNLINCNTIFWSHYITWTTNLAKKSNSFLHLSDAYAIATEIHDEAYKMNKTAKTPFLLMLIQIYEDCKCSKDIFYNSYCMRNNPAGPLANG